MNTQCTETCDHRDQVNLVSRGMAFSSESIKNQAADAFDRDPETSVCLGQGSQAVNNAVYLGSAFDTAVVVNQIRLNQQYGSDCYSLITIRVQSSDDGIEWIDQATLEVTMLGDDESNYNQRSFFNQTSARSWRILVDSNTNRCGTPDVWIIRELEWMGCLLD